MKIFTIMFALLLIPQAFAQKSSLMTSPRHGERVDVSEKSVQLKWEEFPNASGYYLDIFLKPRKSSQKTIEVTGTSYQLRLKKLPPNLYWRVRAKEDPNPSKKLYVMYLYEKPIVNIGLTASHISSRINLKSDVAGGSSTVSGPMVEAHLDYTPVTWKNRYSLAVHFRQANLKNGEDSLEEQRLGAEFGYHFKSGLRGKNILYLGYHFINRLNFVFDNEIKADYNVNFATLRHFYQRPIMKTWEVEIGTGIQLPFPYTFRPSFIFRPLIGKRLGMHWRIDGFLLYENYVSQPKGTEGEKNVDIRLQNMGAGLGVTYRI